MEAEDDRPPHQATSHQRPRRTSTTSWRRSWPPGAVPTIEKVVREAVARFHPEQARGAERAGKAAWDVKISIRGWVTWAGTSWLDACARHVWT